MFIQTFGLVLLHLAGLSLQQHKLGLCSTFKSYSYSELDSLNYIVKRFIGIRGAIKYSTTKI